MTTLVDRDGNTTRVACFQAWNGMIYIESGVVWRVDMGVEMIGESLLRASGAWT